MKTKTATILFMLFLLNFSTSGQVLEQDSLALVAFYNSTGGPNWNNNSGWLTDPVSTWYGVTVEGDRVVELKFYSNNNLYGFVPDDIGDLSKMETFVIGNNPNLTGSLPGSIGQFVNLQWFGIGNCSLTGTIPYTIGNCIQLLQINLAQNNLVGIIPPEIGNLDSLKFLDLNDNQLTGSIPLELGNCGNLLELRLNNNKLTGSLLAELASINDLHSFDVSFNNLSGPVPNEFSYQMSYWFFYINDNNFDYLPPFNNWCLLSGLKVENNKLTFEHLESHAQVGYMWFDYNPQDYMLEEMDTVLVPGNDFSIYSGTGGEYTEYFWYRNGELILQSMEADTLLLNNVSYVDTGTYQCWAENSLATELTLVRRPVHIQLDTGTNITHNYLQKHIAVCPNPTSEKITVYLPFETKKINISITNM
nr:hypothetical protein [Bacteroidota bacterium]